jgi:hypothetical protein
MATFGKQVSTAGSAPAKPTFGKKTGFSPMVRAGPCAAREQLSLQVLALLQAELSRAPGACIEARRWPSHTRLRPPLPASPSGGAASSSCPVFVLFGMGIFGAAAAAPNDNAAFIAVMTFLVILGISSIIYPVSMEVSKKQAT